MLFPAPASADSPTFSGQATVEKATALGTTTTLADTGPLPASGGAQEASLFSGGVPNLLTVDILHATTVGQGDRVRSESDVADLSLAASGQSVSADFLMSRAMTLCGSAGPSVSGSSEIANLVVNGQAITVTGQPNQTIFFPLGAGQVVINEQQSSVNGNLASMTINALHVTVNGVADVVISSSHADITCNGQPVCTGGDFLTGGGWITTAAGAKANFAIAGGIKNGALWGHLLYLDHGDGTRAKGTGVTAYGIVNPTTRHIEGTADINGQGGTYAVDAADNGEPGVNRDTFAIALSNGYGAANSLSGGNPCR